MPQLIKTGMVVGTAKSSVWSQVTTHATDEGMVLALVNLVYSGESDVLEVSAIGAEVLESVKSQLGVVGVNLEKIKDIVGKLDDEIGADLKLSMVGARVGENQLVLAGVGEVEVMMKRGNEMGKIFLGSEKVSGVVGNLEQGDVFVLVTKELVKVVGQKVIKQAMSEGSKLEQLAVVVHGQENSSMLASVVGRVGGETKNKKPKIKDKKIKKKITKDWSVLGKIKSLSRRPMQIRQEQKKQNMMVGVILLVILIIGVGVGVVSRSRVVKENEYAKLSGVVANKLEEASSIADLNPERAKDLLLQADGEIESYLTTTDDEEYRLRAESLSPMVEQTKQEVFRQEQVEIKTLVELSVLGIEQTSEMVSDKDGSVILVDNNKKRLVGVSVDDRSSWEVELGEIGEVRAVGVYDERGYLLTEEGVYDTSIVERDLPAGRQVEPDDLWGEVTGIGMFGGNVYLLDIGQGEIWKYPRITEGFGARRRWLAAGIVLDLSNVVDMKVDGDIWIVTSTGKLERYSRGVPMTFSMEGFPALSAQAGVKSGKFMDPKAVATTEEKVYVLEAGASRVVVFDMESGRYEKQLVSEEFAGGVEMVVIEGRGYVLVGDRVIEFGV